MNSKIGTKIIGYSIIGLIALVLLYLIGEVITRFDSRYARPAYEYDKNLVWRLNNNFEGTKIYEQGKDSTRISFKLNFNENGFRGKTFSGDNNKTKVLILGDSYTAGLDYPTDELFTSILNEKLNSSIIQYEVSNSSCPAWGTDQEFIYWKNEGIKNDPDVLILVMAPNDLREAYNKKIIELSDDKNITINPIEIPFSHRIGWKLANYSSFYQFMQKKWFYTRYGDFLNMYSFYPVNYGIEDSSNWDLPIFKREKFYEVNQSFKLLEAILIELKESCIQNDVKLITTMLPSKIEFDGGLIDTTIYQPGIMNYWLKNFSEINEIEFIDIYDKLVNSTIEPVSIFQSWEFHLNGKGHEFVANELFNYINEHGH